MSLYLFIQIVFESFFIFLLLVKSKQTKFQCSNVLFLSFYLSLLASISSIILDLLKNEFLLALIIIIPKIFTLNIFVNICEGP